MALTILYESLKKMHTAASMFFFLSSMSMNLYMYTIFSDILVILQQDPPIADVCHRLYELNLKILSSTPDSLWKLYIYILQ